MHSQSSVQNVAFWYPEQTLINGNFIPYPSTLTQCGSESVTIRNVTFVNAYFGINYGTRISGQQSNSLQYTRDIYGTCLYMGYHNDPSLDIGKLENFHFSPSFWLESGLPGTPNEVLLRTWMLRNSTGILLQRIDWTYIADIFVDGYRVGIHTSRSSSGTPNGHMYNVHLLDCYYPYFAEELSWTIASKCHFRAVGNEGATALLFGSLCGGEMVFVDAVFESAGDCAIANYGASKLLLTGCTVTAQKTAYDNRNDAKVSMINTTVSDGQDDHIVTDQKALTLPEVDYGKTVVTKPASDVFVDLTKAPYNAQKKTDITAILQKAIDDLKETGGLVYLPAGSYTVSDHIDVWAGVELRGVALWAQSSHATQIHTDFGMGTAEGTPLFTLYDGAGMRGLSIIYDGQGNAAALKECSYAIQGNGSNIYIVDVCLPTSWNGVDLATYRCDNHYVEYLWGAFLNIGIRVGAGSENGVIRDCHFTPNCWCLRSDGNWWGAAYQEIMTHGTPYVIGESKNQILYHNFTYGAYQGLTVLDGAKNVYVLSHGVDSGDISSYFAGNCTVTMINTELVNLNTAGPLTTAHYVYTEQDFEGTLNIINMAGWGPHSRGAFSLNGNGTVNVTGANIIEVGSPMMTLNAGSASVIGLINAKRTVDFIAGDMAMELHLAGNIFFGGLDMDRSIDDNGVELSGADIEAYAEEG
jgi:hypothetical protein